MLDLRLLLANATRWKLLTAITLLTVVVAFFLFGLLLSLDRVFNAGVKVDKADRLVVANAVTIMQPLPLAHEERIAATEGVAVVSRNVFFGGFYQDPANGLMAIATEPAAFLAILPEVVFADPEQRRRWLDDPATIAVGRSLAEKYDWKVGDLVPLYSFLYPRKGGSANWTFRVAAIFDSTEKAGNTNSLLIHYAYLDEERAHARRTVGWYNVRVKDPRQAQQVARRIDALFANSPYETHAATEATFAQELIKQVGDFGLIVRMAMIAVFFTLVLVAANSMIHSVNERVGELATLKALGASDASAALSVFAEAVSIIAVGAALGTVVNYLVVPRIAAYSVTLSSLSFRWHDLTWVALAVLALGVLVSLAPAHQAYRVDTASDLGRAA